jgi:hypothetical protein
MYINRSARLPQQQEGARARERERERSVHCPLAAAAAAGRRASVHCLLAAAAAAGRRQSTSPAGGFARLVRPTPADATSEVVRPPHSSPQRCLSPIGTATVTWWLVPRWRRCRQSTKVAPRGFVACRGCRVRRRRRLLAHRLPASWAPTRPDVRRRRRRTAWVNRGRLQPVHGDNVVPRSEVEHEGLRVALEHPERTVVRRLQWCAVSVSPNKHVRARFQRRGARGRRWTVLRCGRGTELLDDTTQAVEKLAVRAGAGRRAGLQAFARNCEWAAVHQLGRRGAQILLRRRPDAQQNPRQLRRPRWRLQPCHQRGFELPVQAFHEAVGLRMVRRGMVQLHPEEPGDARPQLGGELRAPV